MSQVLIKNPRAYHDYQILEEYEAGLVLTGSEVKSLRTSGARINEAYVSIKNGEAILLGASIKPYSHGNIYNHEEKRERKLLLHKKEIQKLQKLVDEKRLSIVPLKMYLHNSVFKIKIGVGKGKKLHDIRQDLKEKDQKRDIAIAMKKA